MTVRSLGGHSSEEWLKLTADRILGITGEPSSRPENPPPQRGPAGATLHSGAPSREGTSEGEPETVARAVENFERVYEENVAFIHRSVRRLGVPEAAIEDVVQDVFIVAFKRLTEFRGESALSTWLYGIMLRVVRLHRRTAMRAGLHGMIEHGSASEAERIADSAARAPDATVEVSAGYRRLLQLLDELDEEKREIFVLAELEQLPVTEIAQILGLNVNTAYSRLRLARAAFEASLVRSRRSP